MSKRTSGRAGERLRRLIEDSDLNLSQIARRAGVPYQPLWRWFRRKTKREYPVDAAEAVSIAIAGKPLLRSPR